MNNTTTQRVRCDSIPRCLRHHFQSCPAEDAQCLAAFLQRVVEEIATSDTSDSSISQHEAMGMVLAFDLLRDKLDIAFGDMAFPLTGVGCETDLPALWTPKE